LIEHRATQQIDARPLAEHGIETRRSIRVNDRLRASQRPESIRGRRPSPGTRHGRPVYRHPDFKQRTLEFVKQLKETGDPMVLTINGRAALVVQDAQSYQKLLDLAEEARVLEAIRRGLEEMRAGRGRPASKVFDDIRRDFDLPRDARHTA
jgi:PHD/YefM family antitoxin component YafN of YafNO toxin-antitoxin module